MAKLLSALRVGVRVYLDESNQADFTDIEVLRSINYAMHDVVGNVMETHEDYYFSTTPINISTTANIQNYSLDSTIIKIRRVEINYNPSDSNSKPLKATQIRQDELPLYLSNTATGGSGLFNAGYFIEGQVGSQMIYFAPVPTNSGTNNVQVWGVQIPIDLVADTDAISIPYPDRFGYLVELKAAAILMRKGQQEEAIASQYLKEYSMGIIEMKNFLKERMEDGVHMIIDEQYSDIVFDHVF